MRKAELLHHWRNLADDQPLTPTPISARHEGSTYDCDGVRITGSREWIDAVLSHLKPLLDYENGGTRLQVNYQQTTDRETRQPLDSWNCYVQVRRRGAQSLARAMC